jgi:CMP-N,N'-diacetyllegionaminic acid synthase
MLSFTAIIPVRGGSKGIPGKNLWAFDGVSLLARAIRLAHHIRPQVERVIVSTDSQEMQAVALSEGAECMSLRPTHLASDTATSVDVVLHEIETRSIVSDAILLLQATSPLRTLQDGHDFIGAFERSGAPAAASVCAVDEPRPEKLKRIVDGTLIPYLGQTYEGPRQGLPQPYALNGAFYAVKREAFLRARSFLPAGTLAHVMPGSRSHNLDSMQDIQILEAMLAAGHWQLEGLAARPA